jgi:hypothetical protein
MAALVVITLAATGAGTFALAAGSVHPQQCDIEDEVMRDLCCYSLYGACYSVCVNTYGGGTAFTECTMRCWNAYIKCTR